MEKKYEDLIKIAESFSNRSNVESSKDLMASFYLDDLIEKIESEKILMADKIWEEIQRYAENQRKKLF